MPSSALFVWTMISLPCSVLKPFTQKYQSHKACNTQPNILIFIPGPIAGKTKDMTIRHGNNVGTWGLLVEDISRTLEIAIHVLFFPF